MTAGVCVFGGGGPSAMGLCVSQFPNGPSRGLKCDSSTNEHKQCVLSRVICLCGTLEHLCTPPPPNSSCSCFLSLFFLSIPEPQRNTSVLLLCSTAKCATLDACVAHASEATWQSSFSLSGAIFTPTPPPFYQCICFVCQVPL